MHLRIPIVLPGLTTDGFSMTRSATLPGVTMGLRDRIASDRNASRSGVDGVSYYRKRLLEEVDLSEFATLSEPQRRAGSSGWSAAWSAARARCSRPPSARA